MAPIEPAAPVAPAGPVADAANCEPPSVIVGAVVSWTVTVNEVDCTLESPGSVAVQVTVVVPLAKVVLLAGLQLTVGAGVQLSLAVGVA